MAAKAAKDALDLASTTFTFCSDTLSAALQIQTSSARTLELKMQKLDEALTQLNITHTTWMSKAENEDEFLTGQDKYSPHWLSAQWTRYNNLHDQYHDSPTVQPVSAAPTKQQELLIFKTKLTSLATSIKANVQTLSSNVSNDLNPSCIPQFKEMVVDLKNDLLKYEELSQKILHLDPQNLEVALEEHTSFLQAQKKLVDAVQHKLVKIAAEQVSTSLSLESPKMEPSKAPTFSGRTIDYPEFKRSWKAAPEVCWTDANQVEQLKLKVDETSRMIILRCRTMDEIWLALDEEFAQEQEVVNAVDEELKALFSMECSTDEYIVKLRQYLPKLENTLKEVNGVEHLCSPMRVSYLVSKFDERTMRDWEYFKSKQNTGDTTYVRFFNFLLDRYESSRATIARLKSESIQSLSRPFSSMSYTVNHVDTNQCRRCERECRDPVYTCPGCGKGTVQGEKISHCLEHCGKYLEMNPNERSTVVEASSWCPIHLLNHDLSNCNQRSDPRLGCGVSGCRKHHHKTLHGSDSNFVVSVNSTNVHSESDILPNSTGTQDNVLLQIQTIDTDSGTTTCMFDNAATCCLITYAAAERLNLHGEPVLMGIKTVAGLQNVHSHAYSFSMIDRKTTSHTIVAYGVENISDDIQVVDTSAAKSIFSSKVKRIWSKLSNRPTGEIELLTGANKLGLHPKDLACRGNLKVMSAFWGRLCFSWYTSWN